MESALSNGGFAGYLKQMNGHRLKSAARRTRACHSAWMPPVAPPCRPAFSAPTVKFSCKINVVGPMSIQTFEFDDATDQTLEQLQRTFGVRSTAEVIRRAIALATEVEKIAGGKDVIVLTGAGGANKIDLTR
jgi:hypothetical protein